MSGIAIMMMVLFMVVIWGGLVVSTIHLIKNPDDTSGELGRSEDSTNSRLAGLEHHY
ncbi:methionine/alanine import NSS transporter subunit MetS [Corynebacterium marinum]|uniref:Methionine/alanine importer small subunit n=2 Tax=Corynebacterium marinum TaxID=349751 RepID=A0A0B6TKF7_9CORY|nr:methionine/alanine import NSS transporter subunit MetS [Corynebacterium marinum]AJK68423.1 hypothetical protein B840_04020 [Corynebacterium marinum DSM 44953]NLF90606.1 methionine/alanine import NSS transporter subunit MetS [Corynebacterium marinum]GGO15297.1 putative methionine/alanine importer small subunit [Corynebacterium marinum]